MISDRDRWVNVRALFFAALDADPLGRARLLREAAAADASLANEVECLLDHDARANSFLDRPAYDRPSLLNPLSSPTNASASQLTPGEIVADRFEVVSFIGRGGMGEVYEAHDRFLGDTIALKIIRPGFESIETMETRLRREAHLARRITHSSVCRVYDIVRHVRPDGRELLGLTMEHLHGNALTTRLREGQIPLMQLLDIARQVAAGLDAAHAGGVLHRDVKPDNIILDSRADGSSRAVLTDFGLAYAMHPTSVVSRVTQTGIVGTPAYMAPELLRGDAPSVRSDLYAFGVVVRELFWAAARPPSAAERQILQRALDHDPRERFASACELIDALVISEMVVAPLIIEDVNRRIPVTYVVILLAVFILSAFGIAFWAQRTSAVAWGSKPSNPSNLILTYVMNGTNDRELDGATEVLWSELSQSPRFPSMSRGSAKTTWAVASLTSAQPRSNAERELQAHSGEALLIHAQLKRPYQDYVLSVTLEQSGGFPPTLHKTLTQEFSAEQRADLFNAIHAAAVWIRKSAGETPSELAAHDWMPTQTTSWSWQALQLYAQTSELSLWRPTQKDVQKLNEAVQIDPEFAMAYARLGDVLVVLGREREGYLALQRAVSVIDHRQLTTREAFRTRAHYFEDIGDFAEIEKTYRAYAVHYPKDFDASFALGSALVQRERADEAEGWLERALEVQPESLDGWAHLGLARLDTSHLDVNECIDRTNRYSREWAQWLQALAIFAKGNVQEALAALEPLRNVEDQDWHSRASTIRASWLSELGEDAEAVSELQKGILFDTSHRRSDEVDKWLTLADLQLRAGQRERAIANVQYALRLGFNATPRRLARAGELAIRAGDLTLAKARLAELDDLVDIPRVALWKEYLRGQILLTEGRTADAVQALTHVAAVAPRNEQRLSLARALLQGGDAESARRTLLEIVRHPIRPYVGAEVEGPAVWRQALVSLITLTARRDTAAANELRSQYRGILVSR
jgi:serine/threonine protein kinase/thioredoxin-like negative regulator of GroEL